MRRRYLLPLLSCCLPLCATPAFAAAPKDKDVETLMKAMQEQSARMAAQEKKLEQQRQQLEEQQKALTQDRMRFNELKAQIEAKSDNEPAAQAKKDDKPDTPKERAKKANAAVSSAVPAEVGVERKQAADKPPEIAAVIEEGGVLIGKGKLVVTPAFEYTRSSATRVAVEGFSIIPAINIGLFQVSKVDRDILTPSLGLRYGVTNRWEIETKIPYVWRHDSTVSRPVGTPSTSDTLTSVHGDGIGDVEFGVHYQINKGQNDWPFLIGNLRLKTATGSDPYTTPTNSSGALLELPTGSGFWAVQPSVTAIYPSDPVVFYGNIGYLYNMPETFGTLGEISPGDSISASMGMSLSLNDKASVSLGYSHSTVGRPTQNGESIPGTGYLQVGSLDLGYSYAYNDWINLNVAVSAGITEDAPDERVTFRVPMTFDLLK